MSLAVALQDMALPTTGTLQGASPSKGWAKHAFINQGILNTGRATPSYWNPSDSNLKGSYRWNRLVTWFVIYIRLGNNAAANVRVQLRRLRVQIQRKSDGAWIDLGSSDDLSGELYDADVINYFGSANHRAAVSGGGREFKMPSGDANNVHGWGNPFSRALDAIADDIADVFITIEGRLVIDDPDGPDDIDSARLNLSPGGDYYPYSQHSTSVFTPVQWAPGLGGSRYKGLTRDWQGFHFWPVVSPVSEVEIDATAAASIAERTVTEAVARQSLPEFPVFDTPAPAPTPTPTPAPTPTPTPTPAPGGIQPPASSNWFPVAKAWARLVPAGPSSLVTHISDSAPHLAPLVTGVYSLTFTARKDGVAAADVPVDVLQGASRVFVEGSAVTVQAEPASTTDQNGQITTLLALQAVGSSQIRVRIGGVTHTTTVQVTDQIVAASGRVSPWAKPLIRRS